MIKRTFAGLVLAMTVAGCGDDPAGPTTGAIRVSVSTNGSAVDRDPNGYLVSIDAGGTKTISWNDSFVAAGLAPGDHSIHLEGLADNCSVTGSNPVTISVNAIRDTADAQPVSFAVSCAPNLGSFRASIVTSGDDLDTDGYSLIIDGVGPRSLGSNDAQVFSGLRAGQYHVSLSGVSHNCSVIGGAEQLIVVLFNAVTESAFKVSCVTSGTLVVTTATTGDDVDPAEHVIDVQRQGTSIFDQLSLGPNSTGRLSKLLPGDYLLRMHFTSPNCSSAPNPRVVTVPGGTETSVEIDVVCSALAQFAFTGDYNGVSAIAVAKSNGTQLKRLTNGSEANPAWSRDGTRIAFSSFRDGNWEIYVMDADGQNPARLTQSPSDLDRNPAWSPDGTRIAYSSHRDTNNDIYVMNADGSNSVRLTDNPANDSEPAWSPDGTKIAFTSNRDSYSAIWVMNADGSGATRLTSNNLGDSQPSWSPDGKRIAFSARTAPAQSAVFLMNADGSDRTRFTEDLDMVGDPSWSPDGQQIAFTATVTNCGWYYYYYCYSQIAIYGLNGTKFLLPVEGSSEPAWRPR
jgi:Tol biopolymer transport system component